MKKIVEKLRKNIKKLQERRSYAAIEVFAPNP